MSQFDPTGTGVALITPFKDGMIDFDALTALIEHVILGGVEYIVSLGTTGEATSLSEAEQTDIIRHTVEKVAGRVPIVAGQFGGNNTSQLCEKLKSFNTTGISAILSSSPAYVKPSQEGIYHHYMTLAEVTPLPLIVYNVPTRTASNLTAATLVRLAKNSDKFIAVKDASADLVQASAIVRDASPDFALLSGDDPTALACIALGGKGVISVMANAYPGSFSWMIRFGLSGKLDQALDLHHQLLDLHQWLYVEGNPVGIKEAVAFKGIALADVRLPLAPMSEINRAKLHDEMKKIGELN